jgi:hypothetical protein
MNWGREKVRDEGTGGLQVIVDAGTVRTGAGSVSAEVGLRRRCQRPSVSPDPRRSFLPTGGHQQSPPLSTIARMLGQALQ